MNRHPDPIVRRALAYDRARARVKRRALALIDYVDSHPDWEWGECPGLDRLDDLVGEADALRRALA